MLTILFFSFDRLLREEWEKREELERLQEDQEKLLKEETCKRMELEQKLLRHEGHLEEVKKQLSDLETERGRREFQLKVSIAFPRWLINFK